MPDLRVEVADGVLRLVLDRPAVHHAMTGEMAGTLAAEVEQATARDDVRAVLVTSTGPAFCTGADLQGAADLDVRAVDLANRVVRAITSTDKPVVAAVPGVAAGFGLSIALACDLVVAARSASFLLAFTRVGLMPDGGATATVAAAVGRARAMRMALLAESLPAEDAYAAGLVSHLVPDEELAATTEAILARLAEGPPLAFAATKKAVNASTLTQLEPALEAERRGQSLLLGTDDAREGMAAFVERRRPRYVGS